jgi:tetratricopeptide (TPR) repeat protein
MNRFDLGGHIKKISTDSEEAQRWFNLGLNWCYSFNKEEGVKCFLKALEYDPRCVMAHWGVAYGSGPFYNLTWREHGQEEALASTKTACEYLAKARSYSDRATGLENDLVDALAYRFQKPHAVPPEEFDRWDDDYASHMRRVYYNHLGDLDVAALFAEALITRTPRRLWNLKTGAPEKDSDVVEALRVCERAIAMAERAGTPQHPAIVHLHIHVLEMSKEPERAKNSADTLSTLCPDAGHMNHMPAHIYVLCGEYERAKTASEHAIRSDDLYADYAGSLNLYTAARCHDMHFMTYTCMFLGQYLPALHAANKLASTITKEVLSLSGRPKLVMTLEAYHSMRLHVMVRFGRWQEIINDPPPDDPDIYFVTTAMHHYARAIAFASLKRIAEAEEERRFFHESVRRIPAERRFANNDARDVLAVGEKMMDGEVEYHTGNHAEAFVHLRESVRRDDALAYHEPWAWMHPPRHALGALLVERGQYEEAEEIYRDDLGLSDKIQRCAQHPENVWALHGFVECLRTREDKRELPLFERKLAATLQTTDVPITSSCMCRTKVLSRGSCCSVDRATHVVDDGFPQQ